MNSLCQTISEFKSDFIAKKPNNPKTFKSVSMNIPDDFNCHDASWGRRFLRADPTSGLLYQQ